MILPLPGAHVTMVEEPLLESAPLAWRLAPQLCRRNASGDADCAWYHRIWQYLRLAGLGGSPGTHADFYRHVLGPLTQRGAQPRILISGAADYGMLAQVLDAAAGGAAVTVLDRCETPLRLNLWFAERCSARIETHCGEITDFRPDQPFDIVCTHSFFGQIPRAARPGVVAAWGRLLRRGGVAISSDRIRPSAAGGPVSFSPKQAREFIAAFRRGVPDMPGADRSELIRAAETYAARQSLHPVRSREELHEVFEGAGFAIAQSLSPLPAVSGDAGKDSGPAIPSGGDYALIVARRE